LNPAYFFILLYILDSENGKLHPFPYFA